MPESDMYSVLGMGVAVVSGIDQFPHWAEMFQSHEPLLLVDDHQAYRSGAHPDNSRCVPMMMSISLAQVVDHRL